MKTTLFKSLAAIAALAIPLSAFAQVSGSTSAGGSSGSAGTITGSNPASPGTTAGGAGAASSFGTMSDPAALFRMLDTDGDGKLSQQEFARISSMNGSGGGPAAAGNAATGSGTTGSGTSGKSDSKTPNGAAGKSGSNAR